MQTNDQMQSEGERAGEQIFDDELIHEFLTESNENLNRLDSEIVDLERNPTPEGLANIFRTIHTIKGTCGFLGVESLEEITRHVENILSQLRSGQKVVNGAVVSLILETIDAVRRILANAEPGREVSDGNDASAAKAEAPTAKQVEIMPPGVASEKPLEAPPSTAVLMALARRLEEHALLTHAAPDSTAWQAVRDVELIISPRVTGDELTALATNKGVEI